jgi:probable phosphoglycerate mutase
MCGRAAGLHLNETGHEQARQLAERLAALPIAAIYASPLERTRETAQPLADARGLMVQIEPRFIELDYGAWSGGLYADMKDDPVWGLYNRVRSVARPPHGESMLDIQQRAVTAILELQAAHANETVAVVSHADTLRAILLYFFAIPIDFVQRMELSPAGISVLQLSDGAPRVLQINGETVRTLA